MTGVKSTDLSRSLVRRGYLRGSPDRRGGVHRMRALDGASVLRFGRRVRGAPEGAKTPQVVLPDLISNLGVLYNPAAGVKFVYPNLIDQSGNLFLPKLPHTVTAGQIQQLGVQFQVVIPTAQTVSPALISNVGVLYNPSTGVQTVSPNFIDNQPSIFQITAVKMKVVPGFIDNSGVVYATSIGVTPELIDQSGVVYDVAITHAAIDVSPALISNLGVLYNPAVNLAQPNTVTAGFIDQTGVTFTASVRQKTKPLIVKVGVYDPTIEKVGRYVPTIVKRGVFVS